MTWRGSYSIERDEAVNDSLLEKNFRTSISACFPEDINCVKDDCGSDCHFHYSPHRCKNGMRTRTFRVSSSRGSGGFRPRENGLNGDISFLKIQLMQQ